MLLKIKPLKEILASTKEALDAATAPLRARQVRAKADLKVAKLEETLLTTERRIHEELGKGEIDFDKVVTLMDDYDLTARQVEQLNKIVGELFPETAVARRK